MAFNVASSQPNSRETLAYFCLRAIGEGALDIPITEQQMSDRIEDALEFYREFHYDGVEKMYWQHIVTGNILGLANATVFTEPEQIVGETSGATVASVNLVSGTELTVGIPNGTFIIGETVKGQNSGATSTVTSWTNGDISNGYVTCPDYIQGVVNIFPFTAASTTNNVFDIRFQLKLSDIYALQTANLAQYEQILFHLALVEDLFNPQSGFRFNKVMSQIHIDTNWAENIEIGQYITFECYAATDPDTWTLVYNDVALKRLAKAYLKRQLGVNTKMYGGMLLPGNVSINGQQIYDEAVIECKEAEEFIRNTYQLPAIGFIG